MTWHGFRFVQRIARIPRALNAAGPRAVGWQAARWERYSGLNKMRKQLRKSAGRACHSANHQRKAAKHA